MAHLDTAARRAFEQRSADMPPRSGARAEVVLQTADDPAARHRTLPRLWRCEAAATRSTRSR
eukprot:12076135-Alexandrium_andersonii.AAC.1